MILKIENGKIEISVRQLVEFLLRSGHLTAGEGRKAAIEAMQAGSRIHKKIQKAMGIDYQSEVTLKRTFGRRDYEILLEGRADGIFPSDGIMVIDEIKGTYRNLDLLEAPERVHLAQAKCYAYLYGRKKEQAEMGVQMTYCHMESEEIKRFHYLYSREELEDWMDDLMLQFYMWTDWFVEMKKRRDETIRQQVFPFAYRKGQKKLAAAVYQSLNRQEILFLQAPTGIGKTISTIYPTLKQMEEEGSDKVFYLTAKTITRTAAEEAFTILRKQGLEFLTVTLTAKDKICFQKETDCNPAACPYANGHFDRVNEALYAILNRERVYSRQVIEDYAKEYEVCPYELSLDICDFVDGIICDYNYVFDPKVQLRRFFGEGRQLKYKYLIDEAHNLVDRARSMYSATVCKEDFLELRKQLPEYAKSLKNACSGCNKELLSLKKHCAEHPLLSETDLLVVRLLRFVTIAEMFLEEEEEPEVRKAVLELYFQVQHYLNIYDTMEKGYQIYGLEQDGRFYCKLFCMKPAWQLKNCFDFAKGAILFSATLLPVNYYKDVLIDDTGKKALYVPSPFEQKKRAVLVASDVSSRYTRRNRQEYEKIFWYIDAMLDGKKGNYMVFLPSHEILHQIEELIYEMGMDTKADVIVQEANMSEIDREEFLLAFRKERKKSLLALCVLGGIFSEGIDLTNEQLIGTIIVGNGLPAVGFEQNLLKEYFDKTEGMGFAYAYQYPGMNKVLQAAGRVIRTQEDEGIILLLEERLFQTAYQGLFPVEWEDRQRVTLGTVREKIHEFWKGRRS